MVRKAVANPPPTPPPPPAPILYDAGAFLVIHDPTAKDNFGIVLVIQPIREGAPTGKVNMMVRDPNKSLNYFMPVGERDLQTSRILFMTEGVEVYESPAKSPKRGTIPQTKIWLRRRHYNDVLQKVAEILAARKRETVVAESDHEEEEEDDDNDAASVEDKRLRREEIIARMSAPKLGKGEGRRPNPRASRSRDKPRASEAEDDDDEEEVTEVQKKNVKAKTRVPEGEPKPRARSRGRSQPKPEVVAAMGARPVRVRSVTPKQKDKVALPGVPGLPGILPAETPKGRAKKKPKEPPTFKKGVFNHRAVFNPQVLQYEAQDSRPNMECCPDCSAKEFVRAAKTGDMQLFRNLCPLVDQVTSTCVPQGPQSPTYPLSIAMLQDNRELVLEILQLERNSVHRSRRRRNVQFQLVETGENDKYAYGVRTRQVEMARAGREGTNAFLYDNNIWYASLQVPAVITLLCRLLRSETLYMHLIAAEASFDSALNYNFHQIVEQGNTELAALVARKFYESSGFGFNQYHYLALAAKTVEELSSMTKVNVRKKANGNRQVTPMHLACLNPNPAILNQFIELGQELHIPDEWQRKPIHYAAMAASSGPLRLLLDKGIDCRDYDRYKWTPMMFAAQTNRPDNIRMMSEHVAYNLNQKNREGNAAIHIACENGSVDAIRMLIALTAEINLPGKNRMTPLMVACKADNFEVVQLLVESGAKVTPTDKFRKTALVHAAISGNARTLSYLLSKGSEFNRADSSGNTALHYACAYGHYEMIERLYAAGANINAVNSWKLQPILVALMKGHYRCVRMLVNYAEIDVNCQDNSGSSLVMSCLAQFTPMSFDFCQHLITNKNADVNLTDLSGNSIFHKLAMKKVSRGAADEGYQVAKEKYQAEQALYAQFYHLLCSSGISKNQRNLKGYTALEIAFGEQNWMFVDMSIAEPDVDFTSPNAKGRVVLADIGGLFLDKAGKDLATRVLAKFDQIRTLERQFDSEGYNFYHSALTDFVVRCRVNPFVSYYDAKAMFYQQAQKRANETGNGALAVKLGQKIKSLEGKALKRYDAALTAFEQFNNQLLGAGYNLFVRVAAIETTWKDYTEQAQAEGISKGRPSRVYRNVYFRNYHSGNYNRRYNEDDEEEKPQQWCDAVVNDKAGCTLFHLLMLNPIERILRQLLEAAKTQRQYQPNEANMFGETVFLHFARNYNIVSGIPALLASQGEDPNRDDGLGNYPLLQVCCNGNRECFEQFLELNLNLNVRGRDGGTAVVYFAKKRAVNEVTLLLKRGADVNIVDDQGRNALHWTINNNIQQDTNFEMEELLINAGIDVNKTDVRGRQPIHYFFVKIGDPFINSKKDPIEILADFLALQGPLIDQPDSFGNSPLSYAAQRGASLSFGALVKRGADINRVNGVGNRPLTICLLNKHTELAMFCLQKGVIFDTQVYDVNSEAWARWLKLNEDHQKALERAQGKGLAALGVVRPGVVRQSRVSEFIRVRKEDEQLIEQFRSLAAGGAKETPVVPAKDSLTGRKKKSDRPSQLQSNRLPSNASSLPPVEDSDPKVASLATLHSKSPGELTLTELQQLEAVWFIRRRLTPFRLAIEQGADAINYLLVDGGLSLGSAVMDTFDACLFKYSVKLLSKRIDQHNPKFLDQFSFTNDRGENIAHVFAKNSDKVDEKTGEVILDLLGAKRVNLSLPDVTGATPILYAAYHSKNIKLIEAMSNRAADPRASDRLGNWVVSCLIQDNPILKKTRDAEAQAAPKLGVKRRRGVKAIRAGTLKGPIHLMNPSTPAINPGFSNFQGFGFTHNQSLNFTPLSVPFSGSGGRFGESNMFNSAFSQATNQYASPANAPRRLFSMTGTFGSEASDLPIDDEAAAGPPLSQEENQLIEWISHQLLQQPAIVNGRFELFPPSKLKNKGIKPQQRYTLLSYVLKRLRNLPLAKALIQHGADINGRDERGHTVLTWAIRENQIEVFNFLMTMSDKLDFQHQDNEQKTYVHHIVSPMEFASYENVDFLNTVGRRCNLNRFDRSGRPAILYAMAQETGRMLRALKELGAAQYQGPAAPVQAQSIMASAKFFESPYDFESDHQQAVERAEQIFKAQGLTVYEKPQPHSSLAGNVVLCEDPRGQPYDIKLIKVEIKYGHYSENVYYVMQICRDQTRNIYLLLTNWGRVGTSGQYQQTPFFTLDEALTEYKKIFKEKTGNDYSSDAEFVKKQGKYRVIKTKIRVKNRHLVDLFDPEKGMTVGSLVEPELLRFIANITDRKLLQVVYSSFNLDPNSMPFGGLSLSVIQEAKVVLAEITLLAKNLEGNQKKLTAKEMFDIATEISERTSRYLELIPTVGNTTEQIPPFNLNRVNNEIVRLDDLENLEIISRILGAATFRIREMNPYEYCLRSLGIKVLRIPEDNDEYLLLRKYVDATRHTTNHVISAIYGVERPGEADAFAQWKSHGNVRLLWHGTRTENIMGILHHGLRITPSEAEKTGARFGNGLYFADMFDRGVQFSSQFGDNSDGFRTYILLCEVALGKMQKVYRAQDLKSSGTEYQSTKGRGRSVPDKAQRVYLATGTMIPLGRPTTKGDRPMGEGTYWELDQNEYVVYNKAQVKIRNIIELKTAEQGYQEGESSVWD
jgi:ankyrin repeat protein/predicted DNA-binding WGR domain protein